MGDSISALYLQNPELAIQFRRRRMAEQLQQAGTDASPVKHPLEAVSRVAQALLGAYAGYKSDQEVIAIGEKQDARRKEYMSGIPEPSQSALSGMPAMVAGQNIPPPAPVAGMRPFTAANLPNGIDPATDQIVRTVWGEAAGEPPEGQRGVAAVIQNRMKQSGQDATSVIFKPNQFEPWNNPATRAKLEGLDPNSPEYQRILANIAPVLGGVAPDPTNGATHFYSPTAQAALGRETPSWATGQAQDIGRHRFYNIGYQPDSGAPGAPSSVLPPTMIGATPTVTPGIDVGAMQNRAAQLRARGNAGLGDRDPLIRSRAQGFISEADRLDRLAEQERVRGEGRQNLLQDRADAQAEAARKRREGELPTGYRVGADGKPQRMENLPEERRDPLAVIAEIGPLVASGKATPEQVTRYNAYATDYTQPRTVTNERGTFVITPQLPPGMPSPNAAPQSAGLPPGVLEYKNPDRDQPVTVATGTLANADSLRKIQAARAALDKYPQGIGPGNYVQPGPLKDWLDPGGVDMRARLADLASMTLHDRAGSAMTSQELESVKPFIPNATDTPDTARKKLEKFEEEVRNILTDQYKTFGPDAGYRRLPAVEEVLKGARKETASAPRVIQYDATGKRVAQ